MDLAESEKAVVALISAHPQEALARSARESADVSSTSAASSVVRFSAADGYDPQRRFFISGDEIDRILRGSGRNYECPYLRGPFRR